MNNLKELTKSDDFMQLDISEQKDIVLDTMKKDLINRMYVKGLDFKEESTLRELVSQYGKQDEDKKFFKDINKTMIETIECMQSKNVDIINSNSVMKDGITTTYRLTTSPVLSYNYDGELNYIESNGRIKDYKMLIALIEFFQNRFLEERNINRLVRRYK